MDVSGCRRPRARRITHDQLGSFVKLSRRGASFDRRTELGSFPSLRVSNRVCLSHLARLVPSLGFEPSRARQLSVSLGILRLDGPTQISAVLALEDGNHSVARRETELTKKLYVGNLPFSATEAELREVFEQHGTVESVNVITDRETGRPRGFAFIEMEASGADAAREALDGKDIGGRNIRVDEAHDRRGGGGGGRGGGGRGGPGGGRDRY